MCSTLFLFVPGVISCDENHLPLVITWETIEYQPLEAGTLRQGGNCLNWPSLAQV